MNLLTLSPADFCKATKPCPEGRKFALRHATMADVWDACPRPDWMRWICARLGQSLDDRTLRLFAIWCTRHTPLAGGRVTGDLLTDPRLRDALDVAERYADGRASDEELSAAYAAAFAAYATTAYAASCAAYAAAAACTAAFRDADAAAAAADAAYAAAATTTTTYHAGLVAAHAAQADQFRRVVANPFRT